MSISEKGAKYLNTVYLKTKSDIASGYEETIIAKLTDLDKEQADSIKQHLKEIGFIEQPSGPDTKIILSTKGIDYILKWREDRVFKTIRFIRSQYLPPEENATYDFIYSYELIDEDGKTEKKIIRVSISDVLSMIWKFNEADLEKVLLQFAKDRIIEKIKNGGPNDAEELLIRRKTHSDKCPYKPENLIEPKFAEYEIEIGQRSALEEKAPPAISILNPYAITSWTA